MFLQQCFLANFPFSVTKSAVKLYSSFTSQVLCISCSMFISNRSCFYFSPQLFSVTQGNKIKYMKLKKAFYEIKSPFGTIRDPKEILSKWRKLLPFHLVGEIQAKCSDVMEKLGYKLFSSYTDAINFSIPSFV